MEMKVKKGVCTLHIPGPYVQSVKLLELSHQIFKAFEVAQNSEKKAEIVGIEVQQVLGIIQVNMEYFD